MDDVGVAVRAASYGGGVRDPEDMEIEVLVVPDCRNRHLAEQRLRHALHATGMARTVVTTRVVADQAEAERIGFTGSPTILIDGRGSFAQPDAVPSLSCRAGHHVDQVHHVADRRHLRVRHRALGEEQPSADHRRHRGSVPPPVPARPRFLRKAGRPVGGVAERRRCVGTRGHERHCAAQQLALGRAVLADGQQDAGVSVEPAATP
ncbi:hypothetical protein [Streptomyces sp. TLI_185]|uniref:hypothetical protein n=1 Tax=Streptomyces sp. TLI_185 TaxID=2485151 RepID=UPI000F995810|nr:hypothetical protein EDD92_9625 [Streptomyces sp. TLI_185]